MSADLQGIGRWQIVPVSIGPVSNGPVSIGPVQIDVAGVDSADFSQAAGVPAGSENASAAWPGLAQAAAGPSALARWERRLFSTVLVDLVPADFARQDWGRVGSWPAEAGPVAAVPLGLSARAASGDQDRTVTFNYWVST